MNRQHVLQIAALLIAVIVLSGLGYTLFSPQDVSASLCSDGRINCDGWQTGAVYCDASGVRVLYSRDGDPRQGQTALSVSAGQISAVGVPSGSHALLADAGNGYTLHRLTDGRVQFTAPGLEASLYEFRFPFPACQTAYIPPSVNNNNPVAPPVATTLPTPTPIVPTTVTVSCAVAGQYTISMTGGIGTSVTFNLTTTPNVFPLAGTLNGPADSASQNYTSGGVYDIVGSYNIDGGPPQSANTAGCAG
ncbi:MAG: hypothetical protein RLP44_06505 [Aggregatilineales bacterium]